MPSPAFQSLHTSTLNVQNICLVLDVKIIVTVLREKPVIISTDVILVCWNYWQSLCS